MSIVYYEITCSDRKVMRPILFDSSLADKLDSTIISCNLLSKDIKWTIVDIFDELHILLKLKKGGPDSYVRDFTGIGFTIKKRQTAVIEMNTIVTFTEEFQSQEHMTFGDALDKLLTI